MYCVFHTKEKDGRLQLPPFSFLGLFVGLPAVKPLAHTVTNQASHNSCDEREYVFQVCFTSFLTEEADNDNYILFVG